MNPEERCAVDACREIWYTDGKKKPGLNLCRGASFVNLDYYDFADSCIEKINIEYDLAAITVWSAALKKRVFIECSGLAGITNLCIWDDTIITEADVFPVFNEDNDFLRNLYQAYSKGMDYGGRKLDTGFLELKIELSNHIPFSIYCQNIEVRECDSQITPMGTTGVF